MNIVDIILILLLIIILGFLIYTFIIRNKIVALDRSLIYSCNNTSYVSYDDNIDFGHIENPGNKLAVEIYKMNYNFNIYQCSNRAMPFWPADFVTITKIVNQRPNFIILTSQENNLAIIMISGSNMTYKIGYDVAYSQISTSYGLVDCGFWNYYQTFKNQLMNYIPSISGMKIVVTGHSLGGAASIFCSLDLSKTLNSQIYLYTYGCPRVGNNAFVEYFNTANIKSFRYNNTADIVTNLPPSIIKGNIYTHVEKDLSFTLNLGSYNQNHLQSYLYITS